MRLWWLQLVVVIAAEALGAAALLFTVWPVIPVWALSLLFMVVFTVINLAGVKNFEAGGERQARGVAFRLRLDVQVHGTL